MADLGIEVTVFEKNTVILEREIGHGSFGKVFIGKITNTNLPEVAIKKFLKEIKNRGTVRLADKEKAYEELLKLAVIDHENIVKLHGMVRDDMPWLVFEYMKDGNLLEYVRKTSNITEKTLVRFCRDVCSGMVFLHTNNILHKDLAARNILLSNKIAKISDLGLSSFLTNDDHGVYTLNGKLFPFRHAAIECIVEQVYTPESDVWSFGILMYEIFTGGSTPYGKENKEADVRRLIVEHITPIDILEPNCSPKIYNLMKSILSPVLEERPTFSFLHGMFDKWLNGKIPLISAFSQNHGVNQDISSALSAFHKIKTSWLSSSINNLHVSSSPPKDSSSQVSTNNGLLTATFNNLASLSLSSPDIKTNLAVEEYQYQAKENLPRIKSQQQPQSRQNSTGSSSISKSNLKLPFSTTTERRHSADQDGSSLFPSYDDYNPPTQQQLPSSSAKPIHLEEHFNNEPRNHDSRFVNNPLLEGFVQNRFTKRKS